LNLDEGSYIIYVQANSKKAITDKPRKYRLYVSCDNYFELTDKGVDNANFDFLKNIIASHLSIKTPPKADEYQQLSDCTFENTTFGYLFINNASKDNYVIQGEQQHQEMFLMSNFRGKANIPSKSWFVAVGNRNSMYCSFSFYINYTNTSSTEQMDNADCINTSFVNDVISKPVTVRNVQDIPYDFIYKKIPLDLKTIIQTIDPIQTAITTLKGKYSAEMDEILGLKPLSDGVPVIFNDKYNWPDQYYLGEWNGAVKHGRGKIVWTAGGYILVCFSKDKMTGPGKQVDADGTIMEFNYVDDQMDGEGTITDKTGKASKAEYEKGQFVKWL